MAKLYFRYGSMNCGKSTSIIQVAYNYEEKGKTILLLKPSLDTKGENYVQNRSGLSKKVDLLIDEKSSIIELLKTHLEKKLDAILIDEVEFLSPNQIDELYEITKLLDIPVLCYGIRTDYKMEGFRGATRLLEIADDIEEIKNICKCGKKATKNIRLLNGTPIFQGSQVEIDGKNYTYESVCAKCYYELREKYDKNFEINKNIKEILKRKD